MTVSNNIQSNSLMMTVIPEDVFIKLFGEYLNVKTQGRVASVCKLFNELLKKNWIVPQAIMIAIDASSIFVKKQSRLMVIAFPSDIVGSR